MTTVDQRADGRKEGRGKLEEAARSGPGKAGRCTMDGVGGSSGEKLKIKLITFYFIRILLSINFMLNSNVE